MLVLNFPHNPTGFMPSRSFFEAVIALAEQEGVMIFSDEMYRFLEYDPAQRLPAACDLSARAVSLSGLSKSFGLPGLRSGWLAAQDASLLAAFQDFKDYTTICASAPGEILSIIALRAKEQILSRCLEIVQRNRFVAEAFFRSRAGQFEWLEPSAGPIAFPRWLGKEPLEQLCAGMVQQAGVMLVPGSQFGAQGSHFRIGFGRLNFPEVLAEFQGYLDHNAAHHKE